VYKELEDKYANLKKEHRNLENENDDLSKAQQKLQNEFDDLQKQYNDAVAKRDQLQSDLNALRSNHENLKKSYDALEENSSTAIAANAKKNRELLAQLEAKEQALAQENERLKQLEKDLAERSNRVNELESLIAAKDKAMNDLKDAISRALTDFEGKGLTVEQRDGKVYVSMENKLLFKSGSWAVGTEGRKAVKQLGTVLAENPEIAVLIEGHTDNVPYGGNGQVKGNWDLSTKRATAIVQILRENKEIKPENLTAAGRGEFAPVASNDNAEGKAKNRRIEVILTPKLDEISKLLNGM
jgi:chemotaxis protein MotB